MRFSAEDLKIGESTYNTSLPINEIYKVTYVADTIPPITPQRVEGNVPVQQTPVQNKPVQESTEAKEQSNTETKEPNDDTQQNRTATQREHNSTDSPVQPAATAITVATPRVSQTTDRQGAVQAASEGAVPLAPPSLGTGARVDTTTFVIPVDSVATSDTLHVEETKAERKGMSSYTLDAQKDGISLPISLDRSDGFFALLVLCFLILAHVYRGGFSFFKENIMLVFSASKSEKLETQSTTKEILNSSFLVFLAVLLISVSLYEGLDKYFPLVDGERRPFMTITLFVVLILLFIIIKLILNRMVGYVFDIEKRMGALNQSYIVLLSMLGLLCFFPTLLLVYSNMWHSIIIGFVLVLLLLVQLILFTRIIIFFIGQRFNFLYLIAYLCTIEILPYIFLGIGLIYLYQIDVLNTIL